MQGGVKRAKAMLTDKVVLKTKSKVEWQGVKKAKARLNDKPCQGGAKKANSLSTSLHTTCSPQVDWITLTSEFGLSLDHSQHYIQPRAKLN